MTVLDKMAAVSDKGARRLGNGSPELLSKIEGCTDSINAAILIPREDGVISVSSDRTLRVWLKRDSGQYWPSICHYLPSEATSVDYSSERRRLFVGQDNGTLSEFEITEDYNRLIHQRDYIAHQSRINALKFSLTSEWLLSCSKDKYFIWHCAKSGRRLSGYQTGAVCLCLEFDEESKYVFIGDSDGHISVLKLKENTFELITTLKGHAGDELFWWNCSIRCLCWDPDNQLLFSGSFDESVIIWDIGGRKGTAYELQGHKDKIQGVALFKSQRLLLTGSSDSILGVWDMAVKRQETPEWAESSVCQICDTPFFWNFRKMWSDKKVGLRQHHCRHCGKALCHACCNKMTTIPNMGYEYEVRVCDSCFNKVTPEDKAPHATFHDMKHSIVHMSLDEPRKILLTTGRENVMKIWDVSKVLH